MRANRSILLLAFAAACASPDGSFTAVGQPAMPLYEAREQCKAKHSSVAGDGSVETDWSRYKRCMADKGWVEQRTSPASGGPVPGGGGGPSY